MPDTRVVWVSPLLRDLVAAAEGLTTDEIEAAYRRDWDRQRLAEGLEIVQPCPEPLIRRAVSVGAEDRARLAKSGGF